MGYLGTKPANSPLTSELIPDGLISTSDLADNSITTAKILNSNVTPAKLSQPLTSGTAVSASGTSIDFTGIPSWVKRITVSINGVSTNGSANVRFQIGTSSGVETSGYLATGTYTGSSNGGQASTSGFDFYGDASAGNARTGNFVFVLLGSNIWTMSGFAVGGYAYIFSIVGGKTLSGTLDRVRMTTSNGTDTFDAGTINIMYEG